MSLDESVSCQEPPQGSNQIQPLDPSGSTRILQVDTTGSIIWINQDQPPEKVTQSGLVLNQTMPVLVFC